MTKLSKRLNALALFVSKDDSVVDVGCDHGYLSIYLKENKLVKNVIASDINKNALNNAINNINKKKLNIKTILSDGLENINLKNINTLIISGMGTNTILHILSDNTKLNKINKLIIQSNNDYDILRKELNNKGYYLDKEEYTFDKNKWYVTCLFIKSDKKNTKEEIEYGYLNNKDYNEYLLKKQKQIYKKIPFTQIALKIKKIYKLNKLKRYMLKVQN